MRDLEAVAEELRAAATGASVTKTGQLSECTLFGLGGDTAGAGFSRR
jgi:hypothetical protein